MEVAKVEARCKQERIVSSVIDEQKDDEGKSRSGQEGQGSRGALARCHHSRLGINLNLISNAAVRPSTPHAARTASLYSSPRLVAHCMGKAKM